MNTIARQRRQLLSRALDIPAGRSVTRDSMEAAIWHALGDTASTTTVSWLLQWADRYAEARAHSAVAAASSSAAHREHAVAALARSWLKPVAVPAPSPPPEPVAPITTAPVLATREDLFSPPVAQWPELRSQDDAEEREHAPPVWLCPPVMMPAESADMLRCKKCHIVKPAVGSFWRDSKTKTGRMSACVPCEKLRKQLKKTAG